MSDTETTILTSSTLNHLEPIKALQAAFQQFQAGEAPGSELLDIVLEQAARVFPGPLPREERPETFGAAIKGGMSGRADIVLGNVQVTFTTAENEAERRPAQRITAGFTRDADDRIRVSTPNGGLAVRPRVSNQVDVQHVETFS